MSTVVSAHTFTQPCLFQCPVFVTFSQPSVGIVKCYAFPLNMICIQLRRSLHNENTNERFENRHRETQFFLRPKAFSTKLKSNTWLGGISLVTAKLFLVKSIAPRIQASSK